MNKIILPLAALALITAASCSKTNGNTDTTGSVPAKVVGDTVDIYAVEQETANDNAKDSLSKIEAVNADLKEAITEELQEKEGKAREAAEKLKEKGKESIQKGADAVADKAREISDKLSD